MNGKFEYKIIYSPEKSIQYIQSKYSYLISYGFDFTNIKIRKDGSGWYIEVNSEKCIMRFIVDRGELSITFASASRMDRNWFGMNVLIFYITNRKVKETSIKPELIGKDTQFDNLSEILFQYIDKIFILMTSKDINIDEIKKYAKEYIFLALESNNINLKS